MNQRTFGALWDYETEIQNGIMSLADAEKASKADADAYRKDLRKRGIRHASSRIRSVREWWSFGVPCGLYCTAHLVNSYD